MPHSGTALLDPYIVFEKIALSEGMRVADLGCGRTGHFVFPASKVVGERGIVYAVEIVKNILESIKSRVRSEGFDNVQPVWSDIERYGKTPIPEGTLNACFLVNVLFMVKDKAATLREAARLIQKGGTVVVVDWLNQLGMVGPSAEMLLPPEKVAELGTAAELEFEEQFPMGEHHYCILFRKG